MKIKLSKILVGVIGIIGLITTILVYSSQEKIRDTYESNLPLIGLSDNVRYNITKGHLWFEEYMAGDNSIDPQKDIIKSLFEPSRNQLDSLLKDNGESLTQIEDAEMRMIIKKGTVGIDELIKITIQRWDDKIKREKDSLAIASKAGDELDQIFDGKYENIQLIMEDLSIVVKQKVNEDIRSARTRGLITVCILIAIFISIAVILYQFQRKNEISMDAQIQKMQDEENKIKSLTTFADSIGQGNYDVQIELSKDNSDSLSASLVGMKEKLKKVAEEDNKRNWINTGLAQVGEILRTDQENSERLYFNITSFVVKYLNANQGGLFILEDSDNEPYLQMVSCIAFDRKKFIEKKISMGEGLVGRCVQEAKTIYMTEIPNGYISITSGLGQANPTNLLIVPLKINEKIFGVLEIASFYKIEKFQIDFVEKIAESIASTISNVSINQKTKLLLEQAQQQSEELRSQEEEMRQNMEELSATQEEMTRKEQDYLLIIEDLKIQIKDLSSN